MKLKKSFLIALSLLTLALTSWELYWRSQGKLPNLNDDKALWSLHRANVEIASRDDVVILGSSRAYFDIQIDEWAQVTGKKPIQLASTGSSPLPSFHDLVNNTSFNGTVIIGVTPGLFFSTTYPGADPWSRIQTKVDHYYNRTYADRSNFWLSIPLQSNFVLMSADEEFWSDDIDLKSLLRKVKIGNRTGSPQMPPFYSFGDITLDRNMSMSKRTVQDTAFANTIIKVWNFFGKGAPPPDKKSTMSFFLEDVKKFKERNGNLILLRCPSSGGNRIGENMVFPRAEFWDDLVKQSNVPSYHFEDYDQLKDLTCPEESHLSKEDAEYFTREFAKIIIEDGIITNSKTK
jgi:hypothetical protein